MPGGFSGHHTSAGRRGSPAMLPTSGTCQPSPLTHRAAQNTSPGRLFAARQQLAARTRMLEAMARSWCGAAGARRRRCRATVRRRLGRWAPSCWCCRPARRHRATGLRGSCDHGWAGKAAPPAFVLDSHGDGAGRKRQTALAVGVLEMGARAVVDVNIFTPRASVDPARRPPGTSAPCSAGRSMTDYNAPVREMVGEDLW